MEIKEMWYLFSLAFIITVAFIREYIITKKHQLEVEYLVFMWVIHITMLEKGEHDTTIDKEALFSYLRVRGMKIPTRIIIDAGALNWFPMDLTTDKAGELHG